MQVLTRLGYVVVRQSGSHRRLECPGRAPITFAFHDGQSVAPGLVRQVLKKQVGLTDEEIQAILSGDWPSGAEEAR